jgi:hypothetical protein
MMHYLPGGVSPGPTDVVRRALAGTGVEVVGSCSIAAYDARAPEAYRSPALMPSARGLVVAGSAGPGLWRAFAQRMRERPGAWEEAHPYDAFVAEMLSRADRALAGAGISFLRFEAAFHAPLRVDFLALAQLAGLGRPGPFGLLIHPEHGPWWALRGAWLVDVEVEPAAQQPSPCEGCAAPCVGGKAHARAEIVAATSEARSRCVVGGASRYDDDQIAYHHDREATVARLRAGARR